MNAEGEKRSGPILSAGLWILVVWIGVAMVSGNGCGYRFAGSGRFPSGIQSVSVNVFKNKTSQTGAETVFTNSFAYEFSRRGDVALAPADKAAATLIGTVASIRTTTASHQAAYVSAERRLYVMLKVRLVETSSGSIVWGDDNIRDDVVFVVADDKFQTEENKKAALSQLSEKMAESVYNRLISNF